MDDLAVDAAVTEAIPPTEPVAIAVTETTDAVEE